MKMLRHSAAAMLIALTAATSESSSTLPENGAAPLALVGEAKLEVLFWSVYHSRLYCPDGVYAPGARPLRLEIEYLMDIRSKDLVKRTGEEWDSLGITDPAREEWLRTLEALWPDVAKHDVLAVELDQENRAAFFHNGEHLGTLEDPELGQNFVAIWLSPNTSRPKLRLALTGQG